MFLSVPFAFSHDFIVSSDKIAHFKTVSKQKYVNFFSHITHRAGFFLKKISRRLAAKIQSVYIYVRVSGTMPEIRFLIALLFDNLRKNFITLQTPLKRMVSL